MDIKVLYINADGLQQEHSEAADSVQMLSFKTANHELTDAKLGRLIDGADANDEHIHDGRYYRENEHISVSTGVADAAKPVITNAGGVIDSSLIDVSALVSSIEHGDLGGLAEDDHLQYIRVDGFRAFTGNQSMGSNRLTELANPVDGTDAVNLQTLQAYQQGLKPKEAVRAATTAAGTLASSFAAGQVVDGVTLAAGDRILIKNQVDAAENGIYVVQSSGAPVRAEDFDAITPIDEINGAYTFVQEGSENAGKSYVQTGVVGTIGTDDIEFIFFNSADSITASTGLTRVINDIQLASSVAGEGLEFTAGVLDVKVAAAGGLEIASDELQIAADGIKDSMIDWGTGAGQVSAADVPLEDVGGYFATDFVEAALQQLGKDTVAAGVDYIAGAGGVAKGSLVYVSENNTVLMLTTLTQNERCIGLALETTSPGDPVRILADDVVLTGVLTGATAGTPYYWNSTALSATIPSGGGSNVWLAGVAKNATDLHVDVQFIKKNSV